MEFELRAYTDEQDKWSKQVNTRLKTGFEGLTPKLQHNYDAWLTHGQVRQLIFDMKKEKQVSIKGKITAARLKASCVGISLKIQPADMSVQVLIQIGKEDWREIRCYYCGHEDLPDFADINADHFADKFAEEHETEHESNDSVGEDIEEMEYADLMKPGSDCEDSGSELFEFDINEMIKIHSNAKEDLGKIASGECGVTYFKGHFLCMFILRLYLRYTTPGKLCCFQKLFRRCETCCKHKHILVDMNKLRALVSRRLCR